MNTSCVNKLKGSGLLHKAVSFFQVCPKNPSLHMLHVQPLSSAG